MTVLNRFLLLTACGTKVTQTSDLPRADPDVNGWESTLPTLTPGQVLCVAETGYMFEVNLSGHWPFPASRLYCQICCGQGIKKRVRDKCKKCDMDLCRPECSTIQN
jgi:hypothetical protein